MTDPQGQQPARDPLPDLKPYHVDPVFFLLLHKAGVKTRWVAVIAPLVIIGLAAWTAQTRDLLVWPVSPAAGWHDVWLFIVHRSSSMDAGMPFLRDYPSIVLACTVSAAVVMAYSLYRDAERLHGDLERSGCVTYKPNNRDDLAVRINEVNTKLRKRGYLSPLVLLLALALMVFLNLSLQDKLFPFLSGGLYEKWWANLSLGRPGGVAWVVFGAIGIYMVYIEAVLGTTYVNFLRKLHRDKKYEFVANPLNPDGYFGWYRLRRIMTNLQIGLVATILSVWAFSYFLQPTVGNLATVVILLLVLGRVIGGYFSINNAFRRQVIESKRRQALEAGERIDAQLNLLNAQIHPQAGSPANPITMTERSLYLLVTYRQLDHIAQIPSTPIRQRWLVAGVLPVLGALSAIVIPVLQYFV